MPSARSIASPNRGRCCRGRVNPVALRKPWTQCSVASCELEDNLALLFTPPFDKTAHDPGYVKGYLPGIRENGGQ